MRNITRERKHVTDTYYVLEYDYNDSEPGHGFSFDCDEVGMVDLANMGDMGKENYNECIAGTNNTHFVGKIKRENSYWEPAELKCGCGETVYLHNPLDNHCDCGQCFNMSGQQVTPSSQCDAQGVPYNWYEDY